MSFSATSTEKKNPTVRTMKIAIAPISLSIVFYLRLIFNATSAEGNGPTERNLMRIRTAPHAGRPELARPKSLEFTYRNCAIGTGISVVPPIGAGSLGVSPVLYPRRCIGLSEPAARNKRKHDDANQSGGVAHSSLLLTLAPTLQSYASGADSPTNSVVIRSGRSRATLGWI